MTAADHLHYFRSLSPLLGSWAGGQLWYHATLVYYTLLWCSAPKCMHQRMPWCSMVRHAANDAPKCAMPVKHKSAKLVPQKQWFYWPPLHPELGE